MVINRMSKMTLHKNQGQKRVPLTEDGGAAAKARASRAALDRTSSSRSKTDLRREPSIHSSLAPGGDGGGTSAAGDGGGNSGKTRASKKMYFIIAFGVYAFIAALFFILHFALFIYLWSSKMSFFANPGVGFFTVVPDAFWFMWRFLCGTFVHFVLAGFLILILIGLKKTEGMVIKHQDKLLVWVMVVSLIAEYLMFSAVMWYFVSFPVVINGGYADGVTHPYSPGEDLTCYNNHIMNRLPASRLQFPASIHTHVNLRWMIDVSCHNSLWKAYITEHSAVALTCVSFITKLERAASRDCSHATILYIGLLSQLFLDFLGMLFCAAVMYLYAKAVVRSGPGRISFDVSTYQQDMGQLGEFVRRYTGATPSQAKVREVTFPKEKAEQAPLTTAPKEMGAAGSGPEPAKVFHHP